jgi:uncharacterized protein
MNKCQIDARGVISFTLLAMGLAWMVVSPLWISSQGLQHPLALPLMIAMMFTPSIATLIVTRWISPPAGGIRKATGLGLGRHWPRFWLLAWFGPPLLVAGALLIGALFGRYQFDLQNFSGFRELLAQDPAGATALDQIGIQTLVLIQLGTLLLAPLINALPAFGEEWGWRGYLLPQLLPLGQWPALLISGVIWGLWHAPVILLGYNYPQYPLSGWLLMIVFSVLLGILLGWTRLATGSVWPAVIGHAAINGAAGMGTLVFAAGSDLDPAVIGVTGWTGWLLMLLVIGLLVLLRQLPVRAAPDAAGPAAPQPAAGSAD